MSITNPGIFEPFYLYVQKQLNLRKRIIANITAGHGDEGKPGFEGRDIIINSYDRWSSTNLSWGTTDEDGEWTAYTQDQLDDRGLENKSGIDPDSFYKIATEKQCIIQMASAVDIRTDNAILDSQNMAEMPGATMARNFTLGSVGYQGALNHSYSSDLIWPDPKSYWGNSGSYAEGSFNDIQYYDSTRTLASDGFGHVPEPGITDATIDTKSEDGSLREATVNFICHNRKQLEILEALYMRPGYPILLQWGWS